MDLRKIRNYFHFYGYFLRDVTFSLIVPLVFGVLTTIGAGVFRMRKLPSIKELDSVDLVFGVLFTLVVYWLQAVWMNEWRALKGLTHVQQLSRELEMLSMLTAYGDIMRGHTKLPGKLPSFLSTMISAIKDSGGGFVVLEVDDDRYLFCLEQALSNSERSFCAVLVPPYAPDWFFQQPKSEERLKYLELVNRQAKRLRARRIMIFEEGQIRGAFAKLDPKEQKVFFEAHSNVDLYWIEPSMLRQFADFKRLMSVIEEDYALFDEALVLKRDQGNELTLCLGIHNPDYLQVFSESFWNTHRDRFKTKDWIRTNLMGSRK